MLGLHEAFVAGANVDRKILEEVRSYFIKTQVPKDGGWTYRGGGLTTMTMTTAGLSNLLITGADLEVGRQKLRDDGVAELCGIYEENKAVADALRWVGNNFPAKLTVERARAAFQHPYYGLYGIERVGRLTGNRFIGGHDWYRLGCEFFVETQKADGRWDGEGRVWWCSLASDDLLDAECDWLRAEVYGQRSARVHLEAMDSRVQFSSRSGPVSERSV